MRTFLLIILFSCAASVAGAEIATVIDDVRKELAVAREELVLQRKQRADALAKRKAAMLKLETEIRATAAGLKATHKEIEKGTLTQQELTEKNGMLRSTLQQSFNLVRENRKEVELVFTRTGMPATAFDALDTGLQGEDAINELPKLTNILAELHLQHLQRSASVAIAEGEVSLLNGSQVKGEILRIGGVGALFVSDQHCGIVTKLVGKELYQLQSENLSKDHQQSIRDSVKQKGVDCSVVLDITGGRALGYIQQSRTIVDFLKAGGPVVIPLLLLAVVAVIMVIERAIFLTRVDSNLDKVLGEVLPLVKDGDYQAALSALSEGKGPVRRVLRAGIDHGKQSTDNLEEILQESILAELPALERFLGALAVMAAVAPLLGLLGTVSGMISTFQIISVYGTGNAKLLSGGISEALITTEIGLIVAVPILLAHSWLNRHVKMLVGHMDRGAISLVSAIRKVRPRIINR